MIFWTYILASGRNGTLYTGHTDDLVARVQDHRSKAAAGFTARYGVSRLVWFEEHPSREMAFQRERRIKEWRRQWKLNLIEGVNPEWEDLFDSLLPHGPLSHLQRPTTPNNLAHPGEGRDPGAQSEEG